jgi:hypothetical protein
VNSIPIPIKNQTRCAVLVETNVISPIAINLLTRAGISCLPFQNRVAIDEEKTVGNAVLCYIIRIAHFLVFHFLNQQNALIKMR